mmetsp:Transcript_33774/g.60980  ORF Transcript_33774/g.60980 Transcript_33774/m.60980 type:complete len:646 (-) Transcript_33774:934-2871(-)|eukprot:CAMPEP_0175050514 /NCGR_PEP_ID=MMETSP0052_2-20121109/7301_1 /TAXON_ID=51329 ORGANISM="Polytomella parva, Strain SAG 63-3" /NCGR_SAMPLE_ID=MMETSP0052_2 /ASSEMBLY_ACC=CAM_ASM_000194 /LENGTH=645 /DNA_ID=CAMNT_0016314725 /DNA_START=138 /DNA_END=2075 /DNA_ORIENTATION=+
MTNGSKNFLRSKTHFLKNTSLSSILEPETSKSLFTGTKVIITIGPSCQDVDSLSKMLELGTAACRVDLTWGPLDFHRKSLQNLQFAMKKSRRLCATMVDTLGRELMIRRQVKIGEDGWPIHEESFNVTAGQEVILTTRSDVTASSNILPITYSGFTEMAEKGDTIYIGRYLVCGADSASLYLEVVRKEGPDVFCIAKNDALLDGLLTVFHAERSHEGLANVQNALPLFSEYDKECLMQLAQEFEIDFISLSYTREAEDIREARRFLTSIGLPHTKVLAKIESRQALLNFYGILNEADGIIMSRGNLGLDCLPEKMALVQKTLIQACNLVGKPVLITRVVDTMVNTPRPTRAEATDVANAVLDGLDGIVLGAETLRGKYPVETIQTITSICRSAEDVFDHHYHYEHLMEVALDVDDVLGAHLDSDEDTPLNGSDPELSSAASRASVKVGRRASFSGSDRFSMPSINAAARAMAKFSQVASSSSLNALAAGRVPNVRSPYLTKLESIASSAVRAADKVAASLIVVYTHTGKTAQLVAKYRPPMPILTLVIPQLVSDQLHWKLEGRSSARQCLITRGLLPVLAAPGPSGDALLEESIAMSVKLGLVKANDHVVCIQRIHDDFCVKILSVDDGGSGVRKDTRMAVAKAP